MSSSSFAVVRCVWLVAPVWRQLAWSPSGPPAGLSSLAGICCDVWVSVLPYQRAIIVTGSNSALQLESNTHALAFMLMRCML